MEKQEIIDGSKLIAEFMGYQKEGEYLYTLYSKDKPNPSSIQMDIRNNCKYHSSWDWLMPVIEKIFDFKEISEYKESDGWYAYYGLETSLTMVDIEWSYLNCVNFIKWYNETQK